MSILFAGCSAGFVTMESTLKEKPFATETLRGNIADATRCVGGHWKKSPLPAGAWWKANPEALPVIASGIGLGRWEPPVSLVIAFDEANGKTVARAHMHRSISSKDERRGIALSSLAACRDGSRNYYDSVKAIVLSTGDVIEGQILSIEDDELKIRTKDGRILFFSFMTDVRKYIMK
jgi:hypothetical protein